MMSRPPRDSGLTRREVFRLTAGGIGASWLGPLARMAEAARPGASDVLSVHEIPNRPFKRRLLGRNRHLGVDCLIYLMGAQGLKFYRTRQKALESGRKGMIAADDVVLIKVNAQWKYRGCTNSDLVRGLIQAVLDHPDGFSGEIVVIENGQGFGSLRCDTTTDYRDNDVHANANKPHHSFTYLVESVFSDPRVSSYLLDDIRVRFIDGSDHEADGYRRLENVSYPCFTTAGGNRVELREGLWNGDGYSQNLKLINVPVLKHHDRGGSEITASLKHMYGVLSMEDGYYNLRHYAGLGETCGRMFASVRAPVLNIIDAIWVSQGALRGYPESETTRVNQIAASQDPVALDSWAAAHILYPIDGNERHHPDFPGIRRWLEDARDLINRRGGLWRPARGLRVRRVTADESRMRVATYSAAQFLRDLRDLS